MQRYDQLDSLRGVACLMVLLNHFLLVLPQFVIPVHSLEGYWLVKLIRYTPLRVIWAGHEAVMLFFILSGFVLALPFLAKQNTIYIPFAVKRVFRIYIPYLTAIFVAIALSATYPGEISGLSSWLNEFNWNTAFSWSLLADHLLLITNFDTGAYDQVIWSLVHEMRISLLFPLIMTAVIRFHWRWVTLLGLFVSALVLVHWTWYSVTLHYTFMFAVGALLAKHREALIRRYKETSYIVKAGFMIAAILLFGFFKLPSWVLPFGNPSLIKFATDWGNTVGAAMLILAALSGGRFTSVLLFKPVHFIGKISYSIYLYHVILLLVSINLLYGILPIWLILIIAFAGTIGVSALSYYWIELPSMAWGKAAARRAQRLLARGTAAPLTKDA
ncbi:acyltransferase family protein [Paenibacillus puerhi]|uniref:acyltransferase family protein n=1 Tax=Paenibacillus puerhi TaxID=2692622 RepID=UPI00135C7DAC|nr:acyltransferase [Paenibacillus puerhi]